MAHDTAADVTASGSYTSELRVSLVLYGGSSLVMYMNGVAQELLRMVQATAGPRLAGEAAADDPRFVGYDLAARISQHDVDTGYERLLSDDGGHRRSAGAVLAVLGARSSRRRLTIDVLSGASAGGLNAIFLARALLMNGDVGEAERLLVEHGDVLTILNDPQPGVAGRWPKSLLDGDRLFSLVLEGLYGQGEAAGGGALVDALDCYLALTDLRGVSRENETEVSEVDLDHRASAHLRFGTTRSFGADRNDFVGCVEGELGAVPLEPFLAFVARATSAHPAAFHPVQLGRIGELVTSLEASGELRAAAGADGAVPSFDVDHPLWAELIGPGHPKAPLVDRWFSDGGDLDNKPFTHSIDPVESRRASIPVDRKVVWVEPKPGERTAAWQSDVAPSLGQVTFGAYGLPRKEGTFADLLRIQERNRVAELLRQSIDEAIPPSTWGVPTRVPGWVDEQPGSPERRLYEVERARYVVRHLVGWVERVVRNAGGRDDDVAALRSAVLALVGPPDGADLDPSGWNHRRLLVDHDLSYRVRRLNQADQRLARRQRLVLDPAAAPEEWALLAGWREAFTAITVELLAVDRRLKGEDVNETNSMAGDLWRPDASGLDLGDPESVAAVLIEQRREALAGLLASTSVRARTLLASIRAAVPEPSTPQAGSPEAPLRSLGSELTKAWIDFDVIDMHLLPRYRDLRGELDAIEALRFSPDDTTLMGDDPQRRLGGAGVYNFGGFFDQRWRRNDVLWGRLDAAELIVKMLIPTDGLADDDRGVLTEVQTELIVGLQRQIIEESAAAIDDIAALAPASGITGSESGADEIRDKLVGLELDLALVGDERRRRRWGQILAAVPSVLGGIVALGNFDPWKGQRVGGAPPLDEQARAALRDDMGRHAVRVGSVFDALMQLIAPQRGRWRAARFVGLPLLGVLGLVGMWHAYGDDHDDLWWVGAGVVAGLGAAVGWRRMGPRWPRGAGLVAGLGVVMTLAGLAVPLVGDRVGLVDAGPTDQERAVVLMMLGAVAVVVAVAVWLWRSTGTGLVRRVVLGGALVGFGAALWADVSAAVQLLGSLMVFSVSVALFVGLRVVQARFDDVARSAPNDRSGL